MGEWQKVGTVGVDAGMIWIGDPCYIVQNEGERERDIGVNWQEFCGRCEDRGIDGAMAAAQFNFDDGDGGHAGLGVCMRSGPGDGYYDVFVRKAADGRMLEAKIVFEEE